MHELDSGASVELFNSYEPLQQAGGGGAGHALRSSSLHLSEGPRGGALLLTPDTPEAVAMLTAGGASCDASGRPMLSIDFDVPSVFGWTPGGQEASGLPVLHRPDLQCSTNWRGAKQTGRGYSKRYWGDYAPFWGDRFIHGFGVPASKPATCSAAAEICASQEAVTVWTADATFGEAKYNYFKLLRPSAPETVGKQLVESASEDTYQQADIGYAWVGGVRHTAELSELARWSTVIGTGDAGSMESRLENRLCQLTLRCGSDEVYRGLAYNERC